MKNSKQNYKPMLFSTEMVDAILTNRKTQTRRIVDDMHSGFLEYAFKNKKNISDWISKNAKVNIGDVIWVRETSWFNERENRFYYKADYESSMMLFSGWKPSIHMPKEAARIFLKVISVKIERLQNISDQDCISEGIEYQGNITDCPSFRNYLVPGSLKKFDFGLPYNSFISLWESIHGKDSVKQNPFVWIYEFEKIEKPKGWLETV